MTGRLAGKVAIVSGAARGMGAVTTRLFVEHGAKVVMLDLLTELGSALAKDIGSDVVFVTGDVRDAAAWSKAVATAVEKFGGVDILINNAGVCVAAALEDLTMASFKETLDINLIGVMQGMQAVLPAMRARGKGSIVNISSVAGLQGGNGLGAYGASKWAVRGLSKFAALEFGLHKIRVNTVHPGPIDTPMGNPIGAPRAALDSMAKWVPLRRFGGPEEIAHASLYLASDDAAYVNGAELAVDGGWSAGDYEPALPGGPKL